MSSAAELFEAARQATRDGRDLEARLALAAGITALAEGSGIKPIVVGGTAVDFYAATATPHGIELNRALRASQDVDIITVAEFGSDPQRLRRLLAESKEFWSDETSIPLQHRRKWWLHGAPMLVEVLRGELFGDPGRVVELDVAGGTAYLWAPEDTAWQYMQQALSERNRECWARALAIAAAQSSEEWDWDYLRSRADSLAPVQLVDALQSQEPFDRMMLRLGR